MTDTDTPRTDDALSAATVSDRAAAIEIARTLERELAQAIEALEIVQRVACGEDQVADDDTDGMQWISKHIAEALEKLRPVCPAAASLLNGVQVDHDKGLYPTYCILPRGHAGPHRNTGARYWPNVANLPRREAE